MQGSDERMLLLRGNYQYLSIFVRNIIEKKSERFIIPIPVNCLQNLQQKHHLRFFVFSPRNF